MLPRVKDITSPFKLTALISLEKQEQAGGWKERIAQEGKAGSRPAHPSRNLGFLQHPEGQPRSRDVSPAPKVGADHPHHQREPSFQQQQANLRHQQRLQQGESVMNGGSGREREQTQGEQLRANQIEAQNRSLEEYRREIQQQQHQQLTPTRQQTYAAAFAGSNQRQAQYQQQAQQQQRGMRGSPSNTDVRYRGAPQTLQPLSPQQQQQQASPSRNLAYSASEASLGAGGLLPALSSPPRKTGQHNASAGFQAAFTDPRVLEEERLAKEEKAREQREQEERALRAQEDAGYQSQRNPHHSPSASADYSDASHQSASSDEAAAAAAADADYQRYLAEQHQQQMRSQYVQPTQQQSPQHAQQQQVQQASPARVTVPPTYQHSPQAVALALAAVVPVAATLPHHQVPQRVAAQERSRGANPQHMQRVAHLLPVAGTAVPRGRQEEQQGNILSHPGQTAEDSWFSSLAHASHDNKHPGWEVGAAEEAAALAAVHFSDETEQRVNYRAPALHAADYAARAQGVQLQRARAEAHQTPNVDYRAKEIPVGTISPTKLPQLHSPQRI